MSGDRSGERLRGSEQFRADGDSSEGKRGREQTSDTEQRRASSDRPRKKLASREATKFKDFI